MKLDITVIKNESIVKFEKSMKTVKEKFQDMLGIALDAAVHEIDPERRQEVSVVLNDTINDEISKCLLSFTKCMNKCSDLVNNSLSV